MKRCFLVNCFSGQEAIKQKKKVTYNQTMALSNSGGLDNSQTSPFQLCYLLCGRPVILKQPYY